MKNLVDQICPASKFNYMSIVLQEKILLWISINLELSRHDTTYNIPYSSRCCFFKLLTLYLLKNLLLKQQISERNPHFIENIGYLMFFIACNCRPVGEILTERIEVLWQSTCMTFNLRIGGYLLNFCKKIQRKLKSRNVSGALMEPERAYCSPNRRTHKIINKRKLKSQQRHMTFWIGTL